MPTYTVSVTGPGSLAGRFEQMLDVLPAAAMVGAEDTPTVTLFFDVRARDRDTAIERAFHRAHATIGAGDPVTFSVVSSSMVEGRQPWWKRLLTPRNAV